MIQSVGTPYGGSPIAKLAVLGEVFGVTCAANDDLTVDGAERWRRMIPSSAQRQVFFYTTQVSWYTFIHFCSSAFITSVCVCIHVATCIILWNTSVAVLILWYLPNLWNLMESN